MTITTDTRPDQHRDEETARGPLGRIVLASVVTGAAGAVAAVVLFPGAAEHQLIGVVLTAFAAGWAMLALLSTALTDRPQRWSYIPAAGFGLAGVASIALAPDNGTLDAAGWVWPIALGALAVWVAARIRRARLGRAAWMLYPMVLLVVAAAIGGALATASSRSLSGELAMPGVTYPVNGHNLHLDCIGTGSPTVVLENGLGMSSPAWASISSRVGSVTRVCSYDRAGQGWSDAPEAPQDATGAATDLHALLAEAGEKGPYVLAGHSAGGAFAMTYAASYPEDAAGLVLLDSMSPHQFTLVQGYRGTYEMLRRLYTVLGPLTRLGLGPVLADAPSDLPAAAAAQLRAIHLRPGT